MVAQKIYDDPELDWVVLTSNNITNIRDQCLYLIMIYMLMF